MTENEKIDGWTYEETIKAAENLTEAEQNIFKWDVLRHLMYFAKAYRNELKQYEITKKPIRLDKCTCPSCGTHNEVWKKRRNTLPNDIVYCWHCGQAVEIFREEEE